MERQGVIGQMAGAMAPRAPQPGRGTGNIPYASGMISGSFGPKPTPGPPPTGAPPAMDAGPPTPPPQPPQSGGQSPSMAAPPTPQAQQNPFLDPAFYFDVMGSIMGALVNAAESDTGYY